MSSTKLEKVCGIIRQDTAVGLYRIGQPIMFLDKVTKNKCKITPFTGQSANVAIGKEGSTDIGWNDKLLMKIADGADVIWTNIIYDHDEIIKMLDLRKWSGAKWVVDMDDNLYAVTSDNPGQNTTKLLKDNFELCLKVADGVTVSTPTLKKLYENLNPNVFVNPNGTDLSWWKQTSSKHKGIRIGWRGAYGHTADLSLIEPAIRALKKDYNITFVALGLKPEFACEHHEWVACLDYPKKLDSLGLDIAVVPLVDSSYNRCKSNIAVQEYSALKIPVVASPVENQKNMPILYASTNFEWYSELEKLIKDKALREKQGKEQYVFVKENYNIVKLTEPLAEWFSNLEYRKDLEPDKIK